MSGRKGWLPRGWGSTAIAVTGVAVYLFPIYWMFMSGLKNSAEIFVRSIFRAICSKAIMF